MPLQVDHVTPSGVTASFHVITGFKADTVANEVELIIQSYASQAAYQNGKSSLWTRRRTVVGPHFDSYMQRSVLQQQGKDPITTGETFLTTQVSEFQNATIL